MNLLTLSDLEASFRAVMDGVGAGGGPVLVTRQGAESVVLLSLADWNAHQTTRHLLASPANAERLAQSIAQLDAREAEAEPLPQAPDAT